MKSGRELASSLEISISRSCALALLIAIGLFADFSATDAQTVQSTDVNRTQSVKRPINKRDAVGLNPQPEPPSKTRIKMKKTPKPGEMRGLNPQPEPPSRN